MWFLIATAAALVAQEEATTLGQEATTLAREEGEQEVLGTTRVQEDLAQSSLGWGISPVVQHVTTPLCYKDGALIASVVHAATNSPFEPNVARYDSMHQMQSDLEPTTAGGLAGDFAESLLKTLALKFSPAFDSGHSVLHVHYQVPMRRDTFSDPRMCGQAAPVQDLAKSLGDQWSASNKTQRAQGILVNSPELQDFLFTHGTSLIHSVEYGGRLDIFKLVRSNHKDFSLSFLLKGGSAKGLTSSVDTHFRVVGGTWPMDKDLDLLKQKDKDSALGPESLDTLEDVVQQWLGTVQRGEKLAALSRQAVPMASLFPVDIQQLVTQASDGVREFAFARAKAQEDLDALGRSLDAARDGWKVAFPWPWRDHAKDVSRLNRAATAALNKAERYCASADRYSALSASGFANKDETPYLAALRCRRFLFWVCDEALPSIPDAAVHAALLRRCDWLMWTRAPESTLQSGTLMAPGGSTGTDDAGTWRETGGKGATSTESSAGADSAEGSTNKAGGEEPKRADSAKGSTSKADGDEPMDWLERVGRAGAV